MQPEREPVPGHDRQASRPTAPAEQEPGDSGPSTAPHGDWQSYPLSVLDVLLDAG